MDQPSSSSSVPDPIPNVQLPDLETALQLFDETTRALDARARRLEEVLTRKQEELVEANQRLADKLEEIDRLHAYLNLVLGAVGSGVLAVDNDATVTTCNHAAEVMLSTALPDPVEANYAEAFPESPLLQVLQDARPSDEYEHRLPTDDGGERILSAKAWPLRAPDGAMIGAVEIVEDHTELRRLRERLERGERLQALGEMAAGVAHEIRNPLNGIEGFASLLQRDLAGDDAKQRHVTAIIEGVRHLNCTVTDMLAFTSPRQPQWRAVPPDELLRNCVELVTAEYADEAVVPQLCVDNQWPAGETIQCDGTQVRQVLLNIIQNAVQAAVEHAGSGDSDQADGADTPRVDIALTAQAHSAVSGIAVVIDDNGPGVPLAQRQSIFTPFVTTKDHGTGLGLAIAHTMVGLHGGELSVDESPAGGARFTCWLPTQP